MTQYQISNDSETLFFDSEKAACEYLGVSICSVASCFRRGSLCKGFKIHRIGDSFHRETKTRLHKIWESMLERCEYEKHPHYEDYGGRGISVCEGWHDYVSFRNWAVDNGYSDGLSIDRINNDLGYSPDNCRWSTMKEQQRNKRNNRLLTFCGETKTVSEWAENTEINKTTIKERLNAGWPVDIALTKPVRSRTRGYRPSVSCGAKMDLEAQHD